MLFELINSKLWKTSVRLFLDSDGVFADFDQRCEKIFGDVPEKKGKAFWDRFMAEGGFASLPLMPETRILRELLWIPEVKILTGTPRPPHAATAATQKRAWYARNFGLEEEQVITCMSYEKPAYAAKAVQEGFIPILIDDREKARQGWEAAGGLFIHYPRPGSELTPNIALGKLDDLAHFSSLWASLFGGDKDTPQPKNPYWAGHLRQDAWELRDRLWQKVVADEYGLALKLGRDSYCLWTALRGLKSLLAQCAEEAAQEAEAAELAKPLVTGKDLMAMGFKPGPHMGKVLKVLKAAQDAGEMDKEVLLGMAKGYSVDYS